MSCTCKLKKVEELCRTAVLSKCEYCAKQYVLKPKVFTNTDVIPIAANEFISYNLMMLLTSKGVDIKIPEYKLIPKWEEGWDSERIDHGVFALEYYGVHSRITKASEITPGVKYPSWLYWFDMWIGRLDSAGDTNLLLVGKEAIPVDFSMCFHWACGARKNAHPVDFMDIKTLPIIKRVKDDKVKKAIKSITDQELWECINLGIPSEFIGHSALISYWSGLSFRKTIL